MQANHGVPAFPITPTHLCRLRRKVSCKQIDCMEEESKTAPPSVLIQNFRYLRGPGERPWASQMCSLSLGSLLLEGGFRFSDSEQLTEMCLQPEINKCFHCQSETIWCAFLSQDSSNQDHFLTSELLVLRVFQAEQHQGRGSLFHGFA